MFNKFLNELKEFFEPYDKMIEREKEESRVSDVLASLIMKLPSIYGMTDEQELRWTLLHSALISAEDFVSAQSDLLLIHAVGYFKDLKNTFESDVKDTNPSEATINLENKLQDFMPPTLKQLKANL